MPFDMRRYAHNPSAGKERRDSRYEALLELEVVGNGMDVAGDEHEGELRDCRCELPNSEKA